MRNVNRRDKNRLVFVLDEKKGYFHHSFIIDGGKVLVYSRIETLRGVPRIHIYDTYTEYSNAVQTENWFGDLKIDVFECNKSICKNIIKKMKKEKAA